MTLNLPLSLAHKLVEYLKFTEVDTIQPTALTENWNLRLNFTQRSFSMIPTWAAPVEEDFFFASLVCPI